MTPFMIGTTSSINMQSLGKIVQRAPAVGAKMWCVFIVCLFVTGWMPRSGKLPVLFLLTGQKSGFSPRRGDSLHRFRSNFAVPTVIWVRLAVQNFTSIGAEGWECGPQNIKKFHFLFCYRQDCRVAANCRYCFYSQAKNQVFRPAGATRCNDSDQTLQD